MGGERGGGDVDGGIYSILIAPLMSKYSNRRVLLFAVSTQAPVGVRGGIVLQGVVHWVRGKCTHPQGTWGSLGEARSLTLVEKFVDEQRDELAYNF